jgi:hypothetical protein
MARDTRLDFQNTSFHDGIIRTTVEHLKKVYGDPYNEENDGEGKINFRWVLETDGEEVFTIYDWREHKILREDVYYDFHIGAHNKSISRIAEEEVIYDMSR